MEIPAKRLKNGFEIPVYGLGTWQMGGLKERDVSNDDRADIDAIQNAIECGVVHIDTAEMYAAGHAEELIAAAIQEKDIDRKSLFIVSKVLEHQGYEGTINACSQSLKRLNTNYLDLYLIHDYRANFPMEETMKALCELKDKGIIKHIGVSNFSIEQLREAQEHCKYPIVCNQVHYSLKARKIEQNGMLKYCQEHDIMIVAYRPIEEVIRLDGAPAVIEEMCRKYKKTFAQIALNWLISQPNVVTLAKTRNLKHLEENLGAIGWNLETEDVERLRNEFLVQA